MSCYLRHIKDILDEAGITITPANRKQVDQAIHKVAGVAYRNCPAAWRRIKEDIRSNEEKRQVIIKQLQIAMR